MNAIFVANKPAGISSNCFLSRLKRKYGEKKAGFSGTLDPFASGCLIVALGSYTRLFRFLNKEPKIYVATLWLGASSPSGDNENIGRVEILPPFSREILEKIRERLTGKISFTPPKFSAKHVNGIRAYELARSGKDFELAEQEMQIFNSEILHYVHPFLTIKISLSEGGYARSYAQIFAQKLGCAATLSALCRLSEGEFKFEGERFLQADKILNLPRIKYLGETSEITDGKKQDVAKLSAREDGVYLLSYDKFFSIIKLENGAVSYCLNKVEKC